MLSYLFGKGKDAKTENADPELAMREAMDAHGDFNCKVDGTLEFEDFLVFRGIVMRQGCRLFEPKRVAMNAQKLEFYKNKDQQGYVQVFREGQAEFNKCIMFITEKACEWIELSLQNYNLSMKGFMEEEKTRQRIQESDSEVRLALEDTKIEQDEKTVIEASKYKFQLDMEMYRKLAALKYTTSPQAQQEVTNIEMSKISDALVVKYGFDLSHLVRCSKHYKLEDNQELKSFRKIVIAQKESEEKQEFERAQPPKEVIDQIIKEGMALGQPEYKQDGTMTFQYFLDSMKIVVRYTMTQTREGLAAH